MKNLDGLESVQEFLDREAEIAKRDPVPCSGCTACCRDGALVVLFPTFGDDPDLYGDDNLMTTTYGGHVVTALRMHPTGECVFLGDAGCTIYEKRPYTCRGFDCRRTVYSLPAESLPKIVEKGVFSREVVDAGRKRFATMKLQDHERLSLAQKQETARGYLQTQKTVSHQGFPVVREKK